MSRNGHELLKIETYILKVHINCLGCKKKVKKLLRKIEGVYSVNIDAEHQVVIVSGRVDPATLINKLVKSGKHAELWSASFNQKLNHEQANFIKGGNQRQFLINDLNATKNQHRIPTYFDTETTDDWSFENYLNQTIGMRAVTGEVDQNFIAAKDMENGHMCWDVHTFANNGELEDNMTTMMGHAGFQGDDASYVGLGGHEFHDFQDFSAGMPTYDYDHLPSMMNNFNNMQQGYHYKDYSRRMRTNDYDHLASMMVNLQQGYHYNHPSTEMMNIHMQDRQTNNYMKFNGNMGMHQPHYGFSSAPMPYY